MLFTYLTSFCEVMQVVKLPKLVQHSISHKIADQNITLYAFFKMHYLDEQIRDKDYKEDMKLPFKSHDFSGVSITLNIPPEKPVFNIQHHSIYVDISSNFSYSEKSYPSVFRTIWEPPKI